MRTGRPALAAAGVAVLVCSCDPGGGRICTAMGGYSGVNVVTENLSPGVRQGVVAVEVCVDGLCRREDLRPLASFPTSITFPDAVMNRKRVSVEILLRRAGGWPPILARGELAPRRYDINGEGCGPIVWQAAAVLDQSGTRFEQKAG